MAHTRADRRGLLGEPGAVVRARVRKRPSEPRHRRGGRRGGQWKHGCKRRELGGQQPDLAGGYFWVFFDAVRHYGHLGSTRQLWGTALDISADGSYTKDPSHPAFFIPGREFGTGKHRAFAALYACRKDGDKCTSGIDCCGGSCYIDRPEELVEPVGTCSPKKPMCSKRDERCTKDADRCLPEAGQEPFSCIAGFCAVVPPPG